MARGGRRGRPKKAQSTASSPQLQQKISDERNGEGDSSVSPQLKDIGNETVQTPPTSATSPGHRTISSFAALVDPDEGSSLAFVPTSLIDGVKCAKIDREDVLPEIEYWRSAVLCSILAVNGWVF